MWRVNSWIGSARDFHASDLAIDTSIWHVQVDAPAIVVGSSQQMSAIDAQCAASLGYEVVKRRTGGGAVLVNDSALWVDITLPRSHRWWIDDVSKSMLWLGDVWKSVLETYMDAQRHDLPTLHVHHGSMIRTPLSDAVCFAGLAAGEVLANGRKIVGISQRRSREGARFQCVVYSQWDDSWLRCVPQLQNATSSVSACGLVDIGVRVEHADIFRSLASAISDREAHENLEVPR